MTAGPSESEPVMTSGHPICQCVDLRATFGCRYRYERDEAYGAEHSECRAIEAPWLQVIPCQFGKLFPWGDRRLAAYCPAGPVKRRQLERLSCVEVVQGGGDGPEVIVAFDVADFDRVAAVMRPARRRRYSTETRARLTDQLRRVRPTPRLPARPTPRRPVRSTPTSRVRPTPRR